MLAFAFLGLSGLLALSYRVRLKVNDDLGLTTEVALLLTFPLSAASVLGDLAPPAAVAVVAALLLTMKRRLHRWVARIERLELEALLKLALISVVILPLLPNRGYGPGAVLNPYEIWWAVVVVAGVSFLGYAAIRLGGADLGILLTGLVGGLASSTSTTVALARLAKAQAGLALVAASGAVVAGSVTFLRVLALAAIFQRSLIAPLAVPMGLMAVSGLGGAALDLSPRHSSTAASYRRFRQKDQRDPEGLEKGWARARAEPEKNQATKRELERCSIGPVGSCAVSGSAMSP